MPIYEYQCQECNHEFEAMQKFSDPVLKECPECQQPTLKKLISASSFRLKGTGWYETDFKDKPKAPPETEACPQASACCAGSCPANPLTD
jgi:putative FmdB family regulatory protein